MCIRDSDMYGAGQAGIEGVHGAQHVERLVGNGHRRSRQAGLVGAGGIGLVARRGVPGGRYDALVVPDLAVVNDHPVREDAARRFVDADASDFVLGAVSYTHLSAGRAR